MRARRDLDLSAIIGEWGLCVDYYSLATNHQRQKMLKTTFEDHDRFNGESAWVAIEDDI